MGKGLQYFGKEAKSEKCLVDFFKGVLLDCDYYYIEGKENRELVIPDIVRVVGQGACANLSIETIKWNSKVNEICDGAFYNNKLEAINIPDSIVKIGKGAFAHNGSLKKILSFSRNIANLEDDLFSGCGFEHITIPKQITKIGFSTFFNNNLKTIDLSNVEIIKPNAFHSNKLFELTLPKTIKEIGYEAFAFNDELKSVSLYNDIAVFNSKTFEGCPNLNNLTINFNDKKTRLNFGKNELLLELSKVGKCWTAITFDDGRTFQKEIQNNGIGAIEIRESPKMKDLLNMARQNKLILPDNSIKGRILQ